MELRIRELRLEKGIKAKDLASSMGISKNYLSEVENGKKTFNAQRLQACAKALDVPVFHLIKDQSLVDDMAKHFATMSGLNPSDQKQVVDLARFLASQERELAEK